jgi:hypothetical protein
MHFSSFYSSRRLHLAHRLGQRICLRRCISAIRRPFMGEAAEEVERAGMGMVGAEDEGGSA